MDEAPPGGFAFEPHQMAAHLVILNDVITWWTAYADNMYGDDSSDADRINGMVEEPLNTWKRSLSVMNPL